MLKYISVKCVGAVLTLFIVALCTFLLARVIPGGPFDGEKQQPPQVKEWQEQKYGFNNPPLTHFFIYLKSVVFEGDFGVSLKFIDRPISKILGESMPVTLSVGFYALLFSLVLGIPLGILSAVYPKSIWDSLAMFFAISGVTLPTFLIGAILVLVFSNWLGILPTARLDGPEYYILPVVTLGLRPCAVIARLVRATLLDQKSMDYLRTARAKGLDERKIMIRHALSNCWLPIISVLGPISASILTGSFITEHFFAIPGMAKYFISAVFDRDVFLMMGVTLVFSSILIFLNLAVEILAPWIDPRVKKEWA